MSRRYTSDQISEKIHANRGMNKTRKISDSSKNIATYFSFILAAFVLGSVFFYVFTRGWDSLNWDMITGNYHTEKHMVQFTAGDAGDFPVPDNLEEGEFYSTRFGFGVKSERDASNNELMILTRKAEGSPLDSAINAIAGPTQGDSETIGIGMNFTRFSYTNLEGEEKSAGLVRKHDAAELIEILDSDASGLNSLNYEGLGGGFRGSLIATLMVIGLTLVIALPIGIFAAIYLHEVAKRNRFTELIRASIEMLNGVPSIVFGLMGMAVFFPLTAAFGATTPNILLGAITMTVVLLPVIIRQTEEALIAVPNNLRMGSLALGATSTQTIFKVVLPNALPGILTAGLLSISRIIGESAALIYTMGTFIVDRPNITGRATTLAVQIWSIMSGEQPNFELASAISIVVLIMVLLLNISIKLVTSRLNKKWKE